MCSYLGLHVCVSESKTEILAYIYDRLKDRLSGWFARLLSLGGKEVMLKAVAMAMPVYAMSCFKLTKSLVKTSPKRWQISGGTLWNTKGKFIVTVGRR